MRRSARQRGPQQPSAGDAEAESASDGEERGEEEAEAACEVCGVDNARVTIGCAACARLFHLACLTPPLRRRPVLADAWTCSGCAEGGAASSRQGDDPEKGIADDKRGGSRKRGANGQQQQKPTLEELTASASDSEEAAVATKKRRTSTRTAKTVKPTRRSSGKEDVEKTEQEAVAPTLKPKRKESDDFVDPASLPRLVSPARGKAPLKKNGKSKAVAAASSKKKTSRPPPRATTARSTAFKKVKISDDDEQDSADDDADSDFVGDEEEDEEDDDDDESASQSDDDYGGRNRRQQRQRASPVQKRRASPAPKRTPSPKARALPKPRQSASGSQNASNQNGSDVDSLDIPASMQATTGDNDTFEIEDEYVGPSYFIEYAPNARAKCKSCEQKLPAGSIRVGVHVRHSIFGLTTYYKHLECSQLCLSTEVESEPKSDSSMEGESSPPAKLITGIASLKAKDQVLVSEYMAKNTAEGVLDERTDIAEDHYSKKTRMPEKDPSPYLTAQLLPYQREALAWMVGQEESKYKGGILADEMGMGKTLQAISLILENLRVDNPTASKGKKSSIIRGGTLVVCPVVAVMQWKSEIERFVEPNRVSVYIHHGAKRDDLPSRIASHDIVLTTYSIIENEVRKTLGWSKVACKYCKKKYLPEKLVTHNKYFCGPNAKKTLKQDKQQRKAPRRKLAAGEEASDEDDNDDGYPKKPAPKSKARNPPKKAAKKNVIDESSSDDDAPLVKKVKGKSPLHEIHWTRIVLDEAHYIKDRNCNTARGVFELKSEFKWCLTGTPLQNRIGELFSLIRFLQIPSYAFYHCTVCECQMLDFNFPDRKCPKCTHTSIQHFSYFNKKIVIPIQAYGYVAEGKIAMLRLQNDVLQHILLRRTKEGRADDISLPPKLVRIRKDRLDERENDFYEAIYTQSQAQFNTYVSSGTLLNNYAHIFDLLVRLRQAVDHPYLVIYSKSNPALQLPISAASGDVPSTIYPAMRPVVEQKPLSAVPNEDKDDGSDISGEDHTCTICHEDVEDLVVSKCGHDFCRECVKEFIESLPMGGAARCPACSKPLTVELSKTAEAEAAWSREPTVSGASHGHAAVKSVDLSKFNKHSILHRVADIGSFQTSTKIEALMQELELMRLRDPSGKAIIFSQFVNMLDIIQHRLNLGGVKCVKLSGNMSMDMRDRTIRAFREDSSITAFLISLKAGGVALNLTIASHIFLMDPWWNPAAENQAIDRTHRLGQFKPVQATRFIIAGTVEERILKLQEKKQLIFEGTVGASVSAICRLTEEDLRFLFSK